MDIIKAHDLATKKLADLGLGDWEIKWEDTDKRFGSCTYFCKRFTFSSWYTPQVSEEAFLQTVLHEAAHAFVGVFEDNGSMIHHGKIWRDKARELGVINPTACTGLQPGMKMKPQKYTATCRRCGATYAYARKSKKMGVGACTPCCNLYNNGEYSGRFRLNFVQNW